MATYATDERFRLSTTALPMKSKGFQPTNPNWQGGPERLQKLLAKAGFGSRRTCEEWIASGRVSVNGQVVAEPGGKADPSVDDIRVDHVRIKLPETVVYALNKPTDVLCTNRDEMGRNDKLAVHYVPEPTVGRLFPVGRLDKDSEGLLLITNDGELCHKLTHPRHEVPKTYRVTVRGYFSPEDQRRLLEGIWLAEGKAKPDKVTSKKRHRKSSVLDVVLSEGKNREIRRLFARLHHPVSRLQRLKIGPLSLGNLKPGEYRRLEPEEVEALLHASETYRREKAKELKQREQQNGRRGRGKPKKTRPPEAPKPEKQPAQETQKQAATQQASVQQRASQRPRKKGGKHEIIG